MAKSGDCSKTTVTFFNEWEYESDEFDTHKMKDGWSDIGKDDLHSCMRRRREALHDIRKASKGLN